MFDHLRFGVGDYAASKAFFLQGTRTELSLMSLAGLPKLVDDLIRPMTDS